MERPQDYVQRRVEERGVRLIRLWFTDVQGQIKSFAISPAELETAFENGMILTVRQSMDSAVCARKTWSLDLILRLSS